MNHAHPASRLNVIDLGHLPFQQTYLEQLRVHQQVLSEHAPPTVILVEHPPVITISQRTAAPEHLLADSRTLRQLGIDLQQTNRGGDITYHGPGQLVAYPILRLNDYSLNVSRYMRLLEQVLIDTAAAFNIHAERVHGFTGVWAAPQNHPHDSPLAKLAALGIRVRRGVTLHGLALNVSTKLSHFQTIIPCGLAGTTVTSMLQLLGERCPTLQQVKTELARQLDRQLNRRDQS